MVTGRRTVFCHRCCEAAVIYAFLLALAVSCITLPALAQVQLVPPPGGASQQPPRPPEGPNAGQRRDQNLTPEERERRRREAERRRQQQAAPAPPVPETNFPRRLPPPEIRTRFFDGNAINARGLGNSIFTLRFHADGKMERTAPNGQVTNGRWRMLGEGYCSRWEGSAEQCFTVVQEGGTVKVVRGTRAVATWSRP
jgi:hypothetical protein